jgi:hypothetical protein
VVGHRDARHCLLRSGEVVFEGDQVVFVGHGFPGDVEERRDYGIALIAPGFVGLDALGESESCRVRRRAYFAPGACAAGRHGLNRAKEGGCTLACPLLHASPRGLRGG